MEKPYKPNLWNRLQILIVYAFMFLMVLIMGIALIMLGLIFTIAPVRFEMLEPLQYFGGGYV